jgi:hypothetical protein
MKNPGSEGFPDVEREMSVSHSQTLSKKLKTKDYVQAHFINPELS